MSSSDGNSSNDKPVNKYRIGAAPRFAGESRNNAATPKAAPAARANPAPTPQPNKAESAAKPQIDPTIIDMSIGQPGHQKSDARHASSAPQPNPNIGADNAAPRQAPFGNNSDQSDQGILKMLAAVGDKFVIVMTGYRTTGKSWLLTRLKKTLLSRGIPSRPPYCLADFDSDTDNGDSDLGMTNSVDFHIIEDQPNFVIIDIPGERINAVLRDDISDARILAPILLRANALIATLPCDAVLLGQTLQMNPKLNADPDLKPLIKEARMVDAYARQLYALAAIRTFAAKIDLKAQNAQDLLRITKQGLTEHLLADQQQPFGGASGLDCPTFLALTKADKVLSLFDVAGFGPEFPPLGEKMCEAPETAALLGHKVSTQEHENGIFNVIQSTIDDPWFLVHKCNPDLHAQINRYFPMVRYEYVAAFFGHPGGTTLTENHFSAHPSLGVSEILDWISDVQKVKDGKLHKGVLPAARKARLHAANLRAQKSLNLSNRGGASHV